MYHTGENLIASQYTVEVDTKGTQYWYVDGELHREDGPAVLFKDGTQYWYVDGELHRKDGPAIIYSNGPCMWYLNGTPMTEKGILRKGYKHLGSCPAPLPNSY